MTMDQRDDCKLNEKDLILIKKMRKEGHTFKYIGDKFNVAAETIFYHCASKEQRARRDARHRAYMKEHPHKYNSEKSRQYRLKKEKQLLDLVNKYKNP